MVSKSLKAIAFFLSFALIITSSTPVLAYAEDEPIGDTTTDNLLYDQDEKSCALNNSITNDTLLDEPDKEVIEEASEDISDWILSEEDESIIQQPEDDGGLSGNRISTSSNEIIDGEDTADDIEIINDQAVSGLIVQKHSAQDIRSFILSHPASSSDPVTFSETPSTKNPYVLGRISGSTRDSALNMLNTIRYIAGINYNVTSDSSYEQLAQAACVVDAACGKLTHTPTKKSDMSQEMFDLGRRGASSSNLGTGYGSLGSVIQNGWMSDSDSSNIDRLGHRRWILNPAMAKTGFGYASSYSAMYAFDSQASVAEGLMVAWPAQTMPTEFFGTYHAWSLSTKTTQDKSKIKVTLTRKSDNKTWNFSSSKSNGYFNVSNTNYGQKCCIIFRPDNIGSYNGGDAFNVTVTGLTSGSISYDVSFFSAVTQATDMTLNKTELNLKKGETAYLSASLVPSSATYKQIVWTSDDESIATVDQNGKVTAVSKGQTTIIVSSPENGLIKMCKVYVDTEQASKPVNPTPVNPAPVKTSRTLVTGERLNIKKECFSSLNGIAKYKVILTDTGANGTACATVSNKGILTAKKAGKVTIIPQGKRGGSYYDITSLTLEATILPKPVLKFTAPLTYEGQKVNAYDHFLNDWSKSGYSVYRFSSSKPKVAGIDEKTGVITAGSKNGSSTITAYICEKSKNNFTNTIKVSATINFKTPAFTKPLITMQTGQTLILSMKNVNGKSNTSYTTSRTSCLTASAHLDKKNNKTGKVTLTALNSYTDNITLTATIDGRAYTCSIKITPPVINKTAITLGVGKSTTVTLKNTKIKEADVNWVSKNPAVAEVKLGGKVIGISKGTTVVYTETGGAHNECTITVK